MPEISLFGYHLTYDDEFTNPALFVTSANGSVGYANAYSFGRSLPSNGEVEYYVDPSTGPSPFSVQNGELTITAQPALPGQNTGGLPYSSGLISTAGRFSQNTGYFEIRAETPYLQGFWSAFWMLPAGGAGYPELDVMEQPNLQGNNSYWSYASPSPATKGGGFNNAALDLSAGYHSYGLLWTTTSVSFYLDGLQIGPVLTLPPNFTQKMYMIANLAVGGATSWPGQPIGTPTAQYKIDYIRAYSLDPAVPAVALQTMSSPDSVNTTPSYAVPLPIIPATLGVGPDVLVVRIAEDFWQGDARFTISLDGVQLGGVQVATAANAAGQFQEFRILGSFGSVQHSLTVFFLNPADAGTAALARNLHVLSATLNGSVVPVAPFEETVYGPQSFTFAAPPPVLPSVNVTPALGTTETLTLVMSETPGLADARFTIVVDGIQQGGVQSTAAVAGAQQSQAFVVNGNFGIGPHQVVINFLNPTGVTPASSTASALTLDAILLNGIRLPGLPQTFTTNVPLVINVVDGPAPTASIGSGPDVLTLAISEDAYLGNAQFTVSVDGAQQGGIFTAEALKSLGQSQSLAINGSFAVGPHVVTVDFLNNAYGGAAALDRNLYVLGAQLNGVALAGSVLNAYSGGPQSFGFTGTTIVPPRPPVVVTPPPAVVVLGAGADVLALRIAEDAWQGDAQFTISVDGVRQGGIQTATASNAAGLSTVWQVLGSFATGQHIVQVNFLNDAYGGSAAMDRNLYVVGAQLNGVAVPGSALAELSGGPQSFSFGAALVAPPTSFPTVAIGTGQDTILLGVSEDAYLGDAMFTVAVDGVQQGGIQTTQASRALGQSQHFAIAGTFGAGPHALAVTFLNDAYGGAAQLDRNLYVTSLSYNGVESQVDQAALLGNGPVALTVNAAAVPVSTQVAPDSVSFMLTEDAYLGDARVSLSLDGHLLGSPTVTFLNSGKVSEVFTYTGNFGGSGVAHVATVDFLNDAYGGSALLDRNVYVQAITFDNAANAIMPTALLGSGAVNFALPMIVGVPH
jgi:hypothetical protein